MVQLLTHLFILLCVYRSIKMFFWEWSSLNIFMLGWIFSLFVLVALLSSEFWLLSTKYLPWSHTIGYLLGWMYVYIFLNAFCFLLIILYVDRTEWFWGHLFWAVRESLIRRFHKKMFARNSKNLAKIWLDQQINHSNNVKIKFHLRFFKWFKYILLAIFSGFVIGYYDLPMFNLCCSHLWYWLEFRPTDCWLILPALYYFISVIKWYIRVIYPFNNTGYKHLGLTHRTRYIFMPSSEWLRNDFLNRYPHMTLAETLTDYKYLYEIPPTWTSWQQPIIDSHEPTWRAMRMIDWADYRYWLYTHDKLVVYKYSRFDEFDFNLIYWHITDKPPTIDKFVQPPV